MTWLTAVGGLFKGFFESMWAAMRRKRQDQELADSARNEVASATKDGAIDASKKARNVDEDVENSPNDLGSVVDRL